MQNGFLKNSNKFSFIEDIDTTGWEVFFSRKITSMMTQTRYRFMVRILSDSMRCIRGFLFIRNQFCQQHFSRVNTSGRIPWCHFNVFFFDSFQRNCEIVNHLINATDGKVSLRHIHLLCINAHNRFLRVHTTRPNRTTTQIGSKF